MNPTITLTSDGHGTLTIDGAQPLTVTADTPDQASQQLIRRAARFATSTHQNLTVTITDDESTTHVDVTADGHTSQPRPAPTPEDPAEEPQPVQDGSVETPQHEAGYAELMASLGGKIVPAGHDGQDGSAHSPLTPDSQPQGPQRGAPVNTDDDKDPTPPRRSFLTPNTYEEPAQHGWRGFINHLGLRISPSTQEKAERQDVQTVSQHWPGPRVIVVVNQKGGANKTPTTILLSAVLALYGGAGVCAWDTNQLQGTLGWRTQQGPHEATAKHLLADAHRLLGVEAQSADLAHFVHHQSADKFDVLRSQPLMLDADRRFTPDEVDLVRQVLSKYFRVIVVDTSNDPSDPAWLEIVSRADQLVVATTEVEDRAEAGRLLLEDLSKRGTHYQQLATNAVAVVSQADQRASKPQVDAIVDGYHDLVRDVVKIPHDRAMIRGWLRWNTLQDPTRRAWLRAAAAVARGL